MTRRRSNRPWPLLVMAGLLVASTAGGCGTKGLVPVEGRVTFGGEAPPAHGYLYFVPRDMSKDLKRDDAGPLPGTALFAADGSFRASTFQEGDGLRPGAYEVRVECSATPPPRELDVKTHDAPVKSAVPTGFMPPALVVPASGPKPVRYDVDVR